MKISETLCAAFERACEFVDYMIEAPLGDKIEAVVSCAGLAFSGGVGALAVALPPGHLEYQVLFLGTAGVTGVLSAGSIGGLIGKSEYGPEL